MDDKIVSRAAPMIGESTTVVKRRVIYISYAQSPLWITILIAVALGVSTII
jgi:hypothetical protein